MRIRLSLLLVAIAAALHAAPASAQQSQDVPRFSSSVEVTSIDVSVLDDRGRPDPSLTADDFIVKVDGVARRVVSAEFIQLQTPERPAMQPPAGYSSNESAAGGRLIVILVDQPNIRFGGTVGIRRAVNGFIDRLQPADRAAIIGLGRGAPSTPFTSDRERLKKTIERLVGLYQPRGLMLHNIGVAEATEIQKGNTRILAEVIRRECQGSLGQQLSQQDIDACQFEIEAEARDIALSGAVDGRNTIDTLRMLLTVLRRVEGPKTLVFVSEGFMMDDMENQVIQLGTLAAAARTSIYALKLEDSLFSLDASMARAPISRMEDRQARAEGMNLLVGSSRGTLFNVVGTGNNIFERIEAELGGYYLIGVESSGTDKNGKAHPIDVETTRKGLTIRSRRALMSTPNDIREPRNPREAVLAALDTPLSLAALPLRVATYSLQGPEAARVQTLIHAEIGTDYPQSRAVSLGYIITDSEGRQIDMQATTTRLMPVMNGVPSSLQYASGASLPPGNYILKMAVAEGDRVGSIEHSFTAGVATAGPVRLSDLMIGGPVDFGEEILQPTVGYTVVFGAVHGYVEAYGNESGALSAKYEIAAEPAGVPLLAVDVPPRMAGRQRAIFTRVIPVRQLPPGKYYLRVALNAAGAPVETLTGAFEVGVPAVLMSSATPSGVTSNDVYLPVLEAALSKPFEAEMAYAPLTVEAFRGRVAVEQRAAFDKGVQALRIGAYGDAEGDFKNAVSAEEDSSSALAYMAATFAAAGHDVEAISAWQTALVDGSDQPEIYEWLSGALMRTRDLGLCRSVLEEAIAKWPSDVRFARPMALVYATFGQGREAMRSLERHLTAQPNDVESLQMAVEWLYQLRVSNAFAHSPNEDLALAKRYAEAYNKARGPQQPLVKQWLEAMEKKR